MAEMVCSSAATSTGQDTPGETTSDDNMEEETQPETSPYKEPALTFLVGTNRASYTVPQLYARQSPQWTFPSTSFNLHSTHRRTVKLPEIDEDIGHTLVHYLYTGAYQTLKPHGPPDRTTEYRRAILVYCTARLYGLTGLADHAMRNIGLFDKRLSIFDILDVAGDVNPKLIEDEIWLPDYLKTKIEAAFEADRSIFNQRRFLNHVGEATTFNKALVTIMVGIYTAKIASMAERACKGAGNIACCGAPVFKESSLDTPVEESHPPPPPPPPPPPQEELSPYEEVNMPSSSVGGNGDETGDGGSYFSKFNFGFGGIGGVFKDLDQTDKEIAVELADTIVGDGESPPLSVLEGLPMSENAEHSDTSILEGLELSENCKSPNDGITVGGLIESDPSLIVRGQFTCSAEANFTDGKHEMIERCQVLPISKTESINDETEEQKDATLTLASLDGRHLERNGTILDDDGKVIGKLVGRLGKLPVLRRNKATCNAKGRVWVKSKQVPKVRVKLILSEEEELAKSVEPEKQDPAEPEQIDKTNEVEEGGQRHMTTPAEELEPEDHVVAVPLSEPDVQQSAVCLFQARHIVDGEGWQSCNKCRAVVLQLSIQLAHEGDLRWQKSGPDGLF